MSTIDILMITYNRPEYTQLSLSRLLETCDAEMRVWIWQNGSHPETLEVVNSFRVHPRVFKFHHSEENRRLREPTNWMWENSEGDFVCKVDDDCLMPHGWADVLRKTFSDEPQAGVLGCWRFPEEDFVPEIALRKIKTVGGGHRIMQNCWVEGSGYLMRRACIDAQGLLAVDQSFPKYCLELARRGWMNGWYYPFLFQEHMDDPRSQHCELKTDEDLRRNPPLMAQRWNAITLKEWGEKFRQEARLLQEASPNYRDHYGWWKKARSAYDRILRLISGKQRV